MTLRFEKVNGLFDSKALLLAFSLLANGIYIITIKKVRRQRSNKQNGYLWGCAYPLLLKGMINVGWEFATTEQIHEFFKGQFTSEQIVNKDTGEVVEIPSSTSEMDTVTFNTYVDKLREYASEYLGMELPEPDKNWKENENSARLHSERPAPATANSN
jgi:hypothetical protein|nr:MAG TPA: protein NinB [Caudoviricetes sp.]